MTMVDQDSWGNHFAMRGAVCIVSPNNLADALREVGYAVTAAVCDHTKMPRDFNDKLAPSVTVRVDWRRSLWLGDGAACSMRVERNLQHFEPTTEACH